MTRYRPPTKRELGLRNHLGEEAYADFVFHYNYQKELYNHINISMLSHAIHRSRRVTREYIEIHEEEQSKQKDGPHEKVSSTKDD